MSGILTVPYTIYADDGISEANPAEGPSARVVFKCDWSVRYTLARDLLWSTTGSGTSIVRQFGFSYPPSPNLICYAIESIKPEGKPFVASYFGVNWLFKEKALVTALFRVPSFGSSPTADASGQAWTTTQLNVSAEFLTLPETTYRFGDGTPTNSPIGKLIPQVEIVYRRHWVPYLPVNAMLSLVGKVNNAAFTIGDFVAPTGTLLFLAGPNDVGADPSGNIIQQEVEYRFLYRPIPWNYYLHPDRTTGYAVVTDGSGNPPYESGNFSTLP